MVSHVIKKAANLFGSFLAYQLYFTTTFLPFTM